MTDSLADSLVAADREVLASVFASRVALAKMTEDDAAEEARKEHRKVLKWIAQPLRKVAPERSFQWFCEEFDLDVGAVQRAIKEKAK